MTELLAAGFAIGFLGSLHCIGMCGGLVAAMGMSRPQTWWPGLISYQLGRLTTYTALGLVAGLIGGVVAHGTAAGGLGSVQHMLSIFAGLVIILLALHIGGWLPDPFARFSARLADITGLSRWLPVAAGHDNTGPWYTVGVLNGLLPCGLVYAGLSLSLSAAASWQGALIMFSFGLGTVPAMLAAPALLRSVTPATRGRVLKLGAILLIGIGLVTLLRGTPLGRHDHEAHDDMPHQMPMEQISALDPDRDCISPPQAVLATAQANTQ
ncbi:hypothetical protein Tel_07410 [Candidatus Tenderia electrophaga]|jgi:hypothetical protein|uniref:Urease accessory protein UreH-like transmembrane domain-containing protein n=1 Tax=Candidatus Tenderia electrophaga TaxID=1748243 RepID=A0A0S2TD15_9GAMM|nr:hypothetical protein Tel_07410 [Candidatus Tenderia electrophaga]